MLRNLFVALALLATATTANAARPAAPSSAHPTALATPADGHTFARPAPLAAPSGTRVSRPHSTPLAAPSVHPAALAALSSVTYAAPVAVPISDLARLNQRYHFTPDRSKQVAQLLECYQEDVAGIDPRSTYGPTQRADLARAFLAQLVGQK